MSSLLDYWKRTPWIGLLAVLAVVVVAVGWGWNTVRVYGPMLAGEEPFTDFSYYYEAAERFLRGAALYPNPYGFMYPPLSVLLFLPLVVLPQPASFLVVTVGTAVLAVVCVELTLRLYEAGRGERIEWPLRVSLVLIGLAVAPVFQNLKYGQVNVFVLLAGLLFLWLLQRDRPMAAALVLSVGFWLKLYPLALCLLGLRRGWAARGVVGLGLGLIAAPLLALPFVPAELYRQYAFDLVPAWSEVTNMHALNQSIPGVLANLRLPLDAYLIFRDVALSPLSEAVTLAATVLLLGGFYAAYFLGRLRFDVVGVAVLAVLPVISTLGWEYVYVLALPLTLYVLLEARHRGPWARALIALAVVVWMVPKPPDVVVLWTFAHWPRALIDVFYARFLLLTLALLCVAAVWLWRRTPETTRAPAA